MPILDIHNLGQLGVNVDKSPLHLDDNELTKAQNAVHNKMGAAGGITNRNGLVKAFSSAGAGSMLGAVGVPLGPGPGSTTDDAATYFLPIDNSPNFWLTSTNSFSTSSVTTRIVNEASDSDGQQVGVMLNGRLYYIADTTTTPSLADGRSIRVFDGATDKLFSVLPSTQTFERLRALKGSLYAFVVESTTAAYVYRIDSTGRQFQIGAALPSAIVNAGTIGYHHGDVYVSGYVAATTAKIYRIRELTALSTTAWTLDFTSATAEAKILGLWSFKGLLYASVDSAIVTGKVFQRSAAGVYSAVDTGTGSASGPAGLKEFQGFLYVYFRRHTGSAGGDKIRRTSDGTTWATVHSPSDAENHPEFFIAGNKFFVFDRMNSGTRAGYYTTNGTSWTSIDVAASQFSRQALGYFRV